MTRRWNDPWLWLVVPLVGLPAGCRATGADRPASSDPASAAAIEWTEAEQRAADAAVLAGLAELEAWVDAHPEAAAALGVNLVECFLDISYGAVDDELRRRSLARARQAFDVRVRAELARRAADVAAADWLDLLALANYARQLGSPDDDAGRAHLVALANAAAAHPDALEAALGIAPDDVLGAVDAANEDVYSLLMASITLVEAHLLPDVVIPERARALPARLWAFLDHYPLVGAAAYPDRGDDWTFYDTAYLATHIGYLPTGYGRHALRVDDAPSLHAFLRENFDAVLGMGELDLVAEFVDLFRQYGGDEATDLQVRAGARHLLRLFDAAGGSFMRHRESYEGDDVDAYDLIHKAWTGIAGLRRRMPREVVPGSYGAAFDELVRHR